MEHNRALAHLAVEYWKLLRAFERTIERLPQEHVSRSAATLRFSAGKLQSLLADSGLKLITFDGQEFEPNIPATAINVEDFVAEACLKIEITVEPAVIQDMNVLLFGKVLLGKIENGECDVSRD